MTRSLWKSSLRYLTQHPWLMGLSVLGVALGVAVVVSIDLANMSASRAFALSAEGVAGKATHQIVGTGDDLDAAVYRRLRAEFGYRSSAPVVQGYGVLEGSGRTLQLLGVDPLAEGPFRPYVRSEEVDLSTFMAQPRTALMAAPTARALGHAVGDTLRLEVEGVEHRLRLVGLMEPENERTRRAMESLLVVDIATAQELLGMEGRLSRIDLILPEGAEGARLQERLEGVLPAGIEVTRSEARTAAVEQMTRAFDLNLSALSLLALVVGMFLIYNTMTFSVVQRRALIGRLRALGVTRREVFGLVLGEAFLVGSAGTVVGLLLGIVLAEGLVQLITRTINDLYFVLEVRELTIAPFTLLKGAALGLGTTLLAAVPPACEAALAPVSTVLRRSEEEMYLRRRLPVLALAGCLVGLLGLGLLLLPGRSIALGYAALSAVLLGAALLAPALVAGLARAFRPLLDGALGLLGRMAARDVAGRLSRTAVAIAALMVAVSATVGVGVMIDSFRSTVDAWLRHSLQADVYVQPPSLVFRRAAATLRPETVERIRQAEGVGGVYTVRRTEIASSEGPTNLVAINPGPQTPETYRFKAGGDAQETWNRLAHETAVIVSEPYSYRTGLGVGDTLRLQTDRGRTPYAVAGVFYDYASEQGVVTMHRATYDRFYDDRAVSGIALDAAPGQSVDALVERLREEAGGEQALLVRSNRGLREASMQVFDRTFTITVVLRLLAVVVAFIGVLTALMALQLERAHELAVLRASGMTPGQVGGYVTLQTGLMGLIAGLLSLPLGLALAYVLVFVINKRSFGWTLQLEVAPGILLQAIALALAAAVLAGLYPAWKMARANPAQALAREE